MEQYSGGLSQEALMACSLPNIHISAQYDGTAEGSFAPSILHHSNATQTAGLHDNANTQRLIESSVRSSKVINCTTAENNNNNKHTTLSTSADVKNQSYSSNIKQKFEIFLKPKSAKASTLRVRTEDSSTIVLRESNVEASLLNSTSSLPASQHKERKTGLPISRSGIRQSVPNMLGLRGSTSAGSQTRPRASGTGGGVNDTTLTVLVQSRHHNNHNRIDVNNNNSHNRMEFGGSPTRQVGTTTTHMNFNTMK